MIIEIPITNKHLNKLKEKETDYKTKNSITGNKSNELGVLGEIIVADYLDIPQIKHQGTKDYDIIYNNQKIDVKTKKTKNKPLPNYYVSVAATSSHQQCDGYIFTRISNDYKTAWICGYISREDMFNRGKFYTKGQIDPTGNGTWAFKTDCFNIEISKLQSIEKKFDLSIVLNKKFTTVDNEYFTRTDFIPATVNNNVQKIKIIYSKQKKETVITTPTHILFKGFLKQKKDLKILFELLNLKIIN